MRSMVMRPEAIYDAITTFIPLQQKLDSATIRSEQHHAQNVLLQSLPPEVWIPAFEDTSRRFSSAIARTERDLLLSSNILGLSTPFDNESTSSIFPAEEEPEGFLSVCLKVFSPPKGIIIPDVLLGSFEDYEAGVEETGVFPVSLGGPPCLSIFISEALICLPICQLKHLLAVSRLSCDCAPLPGAIGGRLEANGSILGISFSATPTLDSFATPAACEAPLYNYLFELHQVKEDVKTSMLQYQDHAD
ncbi:Chromatin structure-remodeling complex protein SYD [Senna tora]|uniref:Chromatin structure-remodeling complex protein SYD n=1 Tax=Senna tora TaxID=362788 RepID=A0A834X2I1_9FABA|nr:Chromatin structure-remodeling complex protein SYD [Senna tora]